MTYTSKKLKGLSEIYFYSAPKFITLTTVAGTAALNSVVVPDITGYEIVYARIGLLFCGIQNTNVANNFVVTDQSIQVKESVGGTFTTGMTIPQYSFYIAGSAINPNGICMEGNVDVSAEIAAFNKTYAFQWLNADVNNNNEEFVSIISKITLGVIPS